MFKTIRDWYILRFCCTQEQRFESEVGEGWHNKGNEEILSACYDNMRWYNSLKWLYPNGPANDVSHGLLNTNDVRYYQNIPCERESSICVDERGNYELRLRKRND